MKTIFSKEVKRTRTSMLIWSTIVGLVSYFGILEYPVLAPYTAVIGETLSLIPKAAQLFFGVYDVDLTAAIGYYTVMYYWAGLIVFTHATYIGASIISKESRDKTAEFIFTKPYKRSTIVWAKVCAGLVNILVVGAVTTILSIVAMFPITNDPVVYQQIFLACVGMFITQCVLMSLGFLCSAFFKSYKSGVIGAIFVLIASYLVMFLVQYMGKPMLHFLSPLAFFDVSRVVESGLSWIYIFISIALIAVCICLTSRFYQKKQVI